MKIKLGFTLIEVLVVIAILAGLVAIIFPNFMDIRMRARDAQRKSDLKTIQKALEIYKDSQVPPSYPPTSATASLPVEPCNSWSIGSTLLLGRVPGDPSGTCTNFKRYYYARGADPLTYVLYACLENATDPEGTVGPVSPPWFDTVGYSCTTGGSGLYYKVTQP